MNKARRERLAKASALLAQAKEIIEGVKSEEQEKYDNMPENLQNSDRGQQMQEGLTALDAIYDALEEFEAVSFDG